MISWFRKKALTNVAISLARNNLPGLVGKLNSNATKKFEKKKKKQVAKELWEQEKDLLSLFLMKIWMI